MYDRLNAAALAVPSEGPVADYREPFIIVLQANQSLLLLVLTKGVLKMSGGLQPQCNPLITIHGKPRRLRSHPNMLDEPFTQHLLLNFIGPRNNRNDFLLWMIP